MEVIHFTQKQLAARWKVSEASLERWRTEGIGPQFLKLCGRVLYRLCDIENYESSCLAASTRLYRSGKTQEQNSRGGAMTSDRSDVAVMPKPN